MEQLFGSSKILLFFISILYISLNKELDKVQKIIMIYIYTYCLKIIELISLSNMLITLILVSYIYIGFLSKDKIKNLILTNPCQKIVDALYKIIFEYSGIYFLISILLISDLWISKISIWILKYILPYGIVLFFKNIFSIKFIIYVYKLISILILCYIFSNISKREYETNSFDIIKIKMDKTVKWIETKKEEIDTEKMRMLIDVEDKSFFIRENSYNFCSVEFFEYKKNKKALVRSMVKRIKNKGIIKFIRLSIRGYSTIEMQLIRTLGVNRGYYHAVYRKIYEIIYSKLYFKNLRKHYKRVYLNTKGCVTYKEFLLYLYILSAKININGKEYKNMLEIWNRDFKDISKEEFFISILGLSYRKINYNILYNYSGIIYRYNLNEEKLRELIDEYSVII